MKRAFTLIELLVVIAIIAILAAILFPVFAQAKKSAKQSVDVSGIKQISTAFMLYQADYDDHYPMLAYYDPTKTTTPSNWGFHRWPWLIHPYVKNYAVFWSPLVDDGSQYRDMRPDHPQNGYTFGLLPSWGYHQQLFSPESTAGYAPISATQVDRPSETLMLASSIYWTYATDPKTGYFRVYPPDEWAGTTPLSGLSYGHVWPRHTGNRVGIAFADGSVKGVPLARVQSDEVMWNGTEAQ